MRIRNYAGSFNALRVNDIASAAAALPRDFYSTISDHGKIVYVAWVRATLTSIINKKRNGPRQKINKLPHRRARYASCPLNKEVYDVHCYSAAAKIIILTLHPPPLPSSLSLPLAGTVKLYEGKMRGSAHARWRWRAGSYCPLLSKICLRKLSPWGTRLLPFVPCA